MEAAAAASSVLLVFAMVAIVLVRTWLIGAPSVERCAQGFAETGIADSRRRLRCAPGDILALAGPARSGWSTPARALAREPAVLLLDEPSANDQITQRKLQTELAELRDAMAMPVVLVTHDLTEAQLLADEFVLHRKTLSRTYRAGYACPSQRVARLLDQRNLFSATVTAQNEDEGWTELDWFDRFDTATSTSFAPAIPSPAGAARLRANASPRPSIERR